MTDMPTPRHPRPGGVLTAARERLLRPLAIALALYGGLVLLVVTALTMVNVTGVALDALVRPLGGSVPGLAGYEEVVALLIGGGALAFLPYCQLRYGHVAVDLFTLRAPRAFNAALDRLSLALTALLALFLGGSMIVGMAEARADGVISSVRAWPEWPFWLPGIVALLAWSATAAVMAAAPPGPEAAGSHYPHAGTPGNADG
ncbi:TRAP transporter small permease subunit [Rhodospira trueperi]|uniref:TRAP transporter small permease protein n=1 Tax=Rhodospira trueperi TaxID=69960 RepID=A0A1G7BIE5_9PROT|nr:TRAP transporter small permease subunit [Rhodospira trueperi]SDE26844.1 Tripartite ATP-independent transporter, DctQ component [Rhodospira trueperi]